jgi:RNA polymerase sigma factor (sigma-70 family)
MVTDDMALVQEYVQTNSEQAFGALVSRQVNLVYSVAMRQVRDPHLAEEIAQNVFIILSRKAKSLSPKAILSAWLCRTARYIAADTLKTQRRRQLREQESQMRSISNESDSAAWNQIAPLLDEALNCLEEREHDAVVNEMSVEDRFILRQTYAVDAMSTLTAAIQNYTTNHSGQFPSNFEQLTSSGALATTNLPGNFNLQDFEFTRNWLYPSLGGKTILSLRNPIPKPGGGGVGVIVTGVVQENGSFSTHILNMSQ